MSNKTFGEMISSLRKEKNMTQNDLAEKMNVTDKAVSKWERNLSCPDVNSIPKLAEILGVLFLPKFALSAGDRLLPGGATLSKSEILT